MFMVDGKFFDQPVKCNLRTYDNVRKIAIGQGKMITLLVVCWTIIISKIIIESNRFK